MFGTRSPLRTAISVGVGFALFGGVIVSIGIVRAAGDVPVSAVVAADVVVASPASAIDVRGGIAVAVAARRNTSLPPDPGANPPPPADDIPEPRPAVRADAPVEFDRLVVVGDSLAEATEPVIRYAAPGMEFVRKFFGGTAPCDWLDDDLEATPNTVVVITFTGNSLTPCMLDGTGAQLIDEPLIEKYRTDVGVLIDRASAAGAWIVLVGQPLRHPGFDADLEVEGINAAYQQYAATRSHVSYVDAGRFVETPDGHYTDRLPCVDFDTDCAPDGTTVVRGDGVHFCPVVYVNPCPVWSSGAVRFGLGIAAAANDPQEFD